MDGIITDRYTYGAYGELLTHSGDSSIIFLYNGKDRVVTDSNGLYYMRARYYSSYLKRFINADIVVGSIENGDTLNRYAYVNGNPISFVDPFGLSASLADMGHTLLGCLGMVPIIGNAFDLINTLWYLGEGDYFNAGLSAMGFLPGPVAAVVGIGYGVYYAKNGDYVNAALLSIPAIPYIAGGTSKLFKMTSGCNNQSRIVDGVLDIGNGSSGFANEYTLPGDMHPSCFVAGTLIVTESGDKPIEEIEIGDKVYSQDVETGEKAYKEVKNVFINEADTIVHLKVNGEEIDTTESHPFWVEEGWVSARDLNIGDIVTLANGEKAEITDVTVEKLDDPVKVYNFEVEDYHTYFVSEVGVLVHNTCLVNTTKGAGKAEQAISRIDEIEVRFNYKSKYDEAEFARQLADQEAGMNKLTVDEYLKNRERYISEGRAIEAKAVQQAARKEALANKVDELLDSGMSFQEAEKQAQKWLDSQAALHNPDQIAGGNPLNIGGMGDKAINSSIGSQWKYRIDAVDEQIQTMAKNMTDAERKNTYLNVKLKY